MSNYAFGDFRLDASQRQLLRGDERVPLPLKAFELLELLVRNGGALVTKHDILNSLWPDTFVEEANLPNLISLLRKSLGDSPSLPHFIETVPKLGYRFIPQVTATPAPRPILRVLAFPFRTNSPELSSLAFDLADSITGTLSQLNAFAVRPTQLASRFAQEQWDPKTVAREAEVDLIITGTLQSRGPGLHVTAELLDANDAVVLWREHWDLSHEERANLHSAIVQLVLRTSVKSARLTSGSPGIPIAAQAQELFLRANECTLKRSVENMTLARDLYVASAELDPAQPATWAHLGRCYRWLEKFGGTGSATTDQARAAFQRAFALDPHHPAAHAWYTPLECDLGHAELAMARLLDELGCRSDESALFAALVHACRYCGLLTCSLLAHSRAAALDRDLPTSVAHTFFALGDYDRALYWYDAKTGLYLDVLALTMLGRDADAAALLWSRRGQSRGSVLVLSLEAYLKHDHETALSVLRSTTQAQDAETTFYLARQAAVLGAAELSLALLHRSLEGGYACSYALQHDSWLALLRDSAEFWQISADAESRKQSARETFERANGPRILKPLDQVAQNHA